MKEFMWHCAEVLSRRVAVINLNPIRIWIGGARRRNVLDVDIESFTCGNRIPEIEWSFCKAFQSVFGDETHFLDLRGWKRIVTGEIDHVGTKVSNQLPVRH